MVYRLSEKKVKASQKIEKGMSLSDFKILHKLGTGAYSSVYKVQRITDGQIYALKKANILGMNQKQKQNALNQIRILASVRHENIIGYRQAFLDQSSKSLCIIMEFADNGDLYQKIIQKTKENQLFNQQFIWDVMIQFLRGLKCLHQRKIMHRDLKSANVFLTKTGQVKLGDLNVSKVAEKGLCKTQTGTPYYASPQVWKDQQYGPKSDIWSFGCVIYEMTALKPPFQADDMQGLFRTVIKGQYPKIPSIYSNDLSSLIRILLQTDPYRRPSCEKILGMKMLLKHTQLLNKEVQYENPDFLKTIYMPKNIQNLTQNLPKSNYFKPKSKSMMAQQRMTHNKTEKLYKKYPDEEENWVVLPKLSRKKQLSSYHLGSQRKQSETIQQKGNPYRMESKHPKKEKEKEKNKNYIKLNKQINEIKYRMLNKQQQKKQRIIDQSMPCIKLTRKNIEADHQLESLQKIYKKSLNKKL